MLPQSTAYCPYWTKVQYRSLHARLILSRLLCPEHFHDNVNRPDDGDDPRRRSAAFFDFDPSTRERPLSTRASASSPHRPHAGAIACQPFTREPAMRSITNWDLVEAREAVRQAAFGLARSGAFDGWQDVWRALRGRFDIDQLARIFENPLSQLDIDQRCKRARNPSLVGCRGERQYPQMARDESRPVATWIPAPLDCKTRRAPGLAERIVALLADGSECTAVHLAEQLDTSRGEVLRALRPLVNDGLLQVKRCLVGPHGGRGARVFACAAARLDCDERGMRAPWGQADPVVAAAMDAVARHN